MTRYLIRIGWAMAFSYVGWSLPAKADEDKTSQSVTVAKAWLEIVDQSSYAESWDKASDYFKNAITRENWERMLAGVRNPLGPVIERVIKSKKYTTTAPGAPDGEYVILQFDTSFENKKSAIETVTTMRDKDGVFRVAGYYIK